MTKFIAPTNQAMWRAPATARNVETSKPMGSPCSARPPACRPAATRVRDAWLMPDALVAWPPGPPARRAWATVDLTLSGALHRDYRQGYEKPLISALPVNRSSGSRLRRPPKLPPGRLAEVALSPTSPSPCPAPRVTGIGTIRLTSPSATETAFDAADLVIAVAAVAVAAQYGLRHRSSSGGLGRLRSNCRPPNPTSSPAAPSAPASRGAYPCTRGLCR